MFTTTARLKQNVAIFGSILLGWSVGDEILVIQKTSDGEWEDAKRPGISLPPESLDFDC